MHFGALIPVAETAVTAGLAAWMAVAGFWRRPTGQLLSWTMFCYATFTIVSLRGTRAGRTQDVNIYDVVPPGSFFVPPAQLALILEFLSSTGTFEDLQGEGRVLSRHGERPITVRNGRVVL
ncbi:hypothetical protein ACFVUH_07980 [Kitasatospora sp. NPDC058032]|uniref:hypothetical protein n=1 Tax=Kitasatospora sp. NPDC058032 TaxID=3346307 RepID=UPI0036D83A98